MKLIYLTIENPFYPGGKGKARELSILDLLAEVVDVEGLCFAPAARGELLAPIPPKTTVVEFARPRGLLGKFLQLFSRPGFWNRRSRRDRVTIELAQQYAPGAVLWVAHLALRRYIPVARKLGYRVLADVPPFSPPPRATQSGRRLQPDQWVTATPRDLEWYGKRFGATKVAYLPTAIATNGHLKVTAATSSPSAEAIFFGGALNSPSNEEGLRWFGQHIIPRLKAHYGLATPRILVAGRFPSDDLRKYLESRGIEVFANPPDLVPFLAEAGLVIFPIRRAGAAARRVLEAMAAGRPVLATPQAIHGLILAPCHDVWIAEDADRFTSAIVKLWADKALRSALGQAAARTAQERYDRSIAQGKLKELVQRISY